MKDPQACFPFWRFICAVLTLLIFLLALMPAASAPSGLGWDKLNHAAAIAAASVLAYLSFLPHRWAVRGAFLYGSALGILIELLQALPASGRSAEWGDVAADLIGAGSAWLAIRFFTRRTAPER